MDARPPSLESADDSAAAISRRGQPRNVGLELNTATPSHPGLPRECKPGPQMDFSTDHSFFGTPIYHWRAHGTRPNPNRAKRKFRHEEDEDGEDEDAQLPSDGHVDSAFHGGGAQRGDGEELGQLEEEGSIQPRSSNGADASLTEGTGLLEDEETATYPSSLSTARAHPRYLNREGRYKRNVENLARQGLFMPPRRPMELRTRHEAILNAILQKSVLTRDWDRAKRAFGLLVRGRWVDLRKVWDLGRDLILRTGERPDSQPVDELSASQERIRKEKNQAQAAEYLNRLILQYPFTINRFGHKIPKASDSEFATFEAERAETAAMKQQKKWEMGKTTYASAIDFYPVLIALLIDSSGYSDNDAAHSDEHGRISRKEYYLSPSVDLFAPSHPQKIKEHLEEIMLTPPWSDDSRLWCIRGMICLWLADLEVAPDDDQVYDDGYETPHSLQSDNEEEDDAFRRRENRRGAVAERERKERMARREKLLQEAKSYLDKVEETGGDVPEIVSEAMRELLQNQEEED